MPQYVITQRRRGSGIVMKGIAGEAFPRGRALYMSDTDGLWYQADSDAAATMPMIGVSMERAAVANTIVNIVMIGYVGRGDWTWTRGDPLYVSGTPGVLTQVAPAANIQVIGYPITSNLIYVNPSGVDAGGFGGDPDFYPAPDPDTNIGQHAAMRLIDGVDVTIRMDFTLPTDYVDGTWSVDVVLVAGGTGDLRRGVVTDFGQVCVENYALHNDSIAAGQVAVTGNILECIDITDALTGSNPSDLVGMEFTRYASNAADTVNADCYFLGVLIRRP